MTENEALEAVRAKCASGDKELDCVQLDRIMGEFLRSNGYGRLAEAILDLNISCNMRF